MGTKTVELWDGEDLPPIGSIVCVASATDLGERYAVRVTSYGLSDDANEVATRYGVVINAEYLDRSTVQRTLGRLYLHDLIKTTEKDPRG